MNIERITIDSIPAMIWGEKSNKVYIAVHGNMSNKEDEVCYFRLHLFYFMKIIYIIYIILIDLIP